MTNQEILKAAIEKADANGFSSFQKYDLEDFNEIIELGLSEHIIFSHDFAKAFWGGEKVYCECHGRDSCSKDFIDYKWEYYLQQMVLEKCPIQYLKKFI